MPVTDLQSFTALHLASREGHNDVVTRLLDRGADVHAKTAQVSAPLA